MFLYFGVCLQFLRFTGFRRVAFSRKQSFQFILIAPDKATKQSRDLSLCLCFIQCFIHNASKSSPEQDRRD